MRLGKLKKEFDLLLRWAKPIKYGYHLFGNWILSQAQL